MKDVLSCRTGRLDAALQRVRGARVTEVCGRVNPNAGAQDGRPMKLVADLAYMHLIDEASGRVL